ncbi:hypothetical protein [Frigoriflavimonas asaccharolytica]|uniref:Uncharacterized protein n=1 Tax=Frigoriflavimonas asaccharolytica TaxID=2735899 RepID=A0A8J8K6T0_9FLAO|nr:hypothetical protein [Frigoriflavimonas asaccharolytica]NRS94080.1 hypothetical protein [Frigoriflavimonas asaccharolytica]
MNKIKNLILVICVLFLNCQEKKVNNSLVNKNSDITSNQIIYNEISFDLKYLQSENNIESYKLHHYKLMLNAKNEKAEIVINNKFYPVNLNFTYDTDSDDAISKIKIFRNSKSDEIIFIPTFGSNDEYTYQLLLLKNKIVYENIISFSALTNSPSPKKIQITEENNSFKFNIDDINLMTVFRRQLISSEIKMQKEVDSEEVSEETISTNRKTIDSLLFDFNNDQKIDKVLIQAHPNENKAFGNEYFDNINSYFRTIVVMRGEKNNSFTQIASNRNIVPCLRCNEPMNSFSEFKRIGNNSFSVEVIQKSKETIYHLVFEWKGDGFYLKQLGQQYFNDEKFKNIKLNYSIKFTEFDINKLSIYDKSN